MDNAKLVQQVVQNLSEAIVYADSSNFETNKKLWNQV